MSELLPQRLTEARAEFRQVRGPVELGQALCRGGGPDMILEDHPWLREAAAYFPEGPHRKIQFMSADSDLRPADVDTVVTVGLGAVPETGSVLVGGAAPAWRLSLSPRRHLIVIAAERTGLTMAAALALTAAEPSGLVSWLTGPSRTADIEKVLVLGAQGAAELAVISYQREIS